MATSRAAKTSGYFTRYNGPLDIFGKAGDQTLRQCQAGAYWAAWAHFTSTAEPALISLPTGAGKTALMMALAFGLKAARCLIITPSALLRDQIARGFETLDDLKSRGVLPKNTPSPCVHSNSRTLATDKAWNSLRQFDVVVATPKTVSKIERGIVPPPTDLFDLVFFDEGHHEAAPSYRAILESFPSAKRVLLTGTPYRRDRKRLGAPLIYYYPIGRAVDAGIYVPVTYCPVDTTGKPQQGRDKALCDQAVRLYEQERRKKRPALLLIRTDSVEHAKELESIYTKAKLKIARVDYEQTLHSNNNALISLRQGKLDGIVCIGMMGEGIDVPDLKIAILHAPPLSLPLTVQIIGRLARTSGPDAKAFLVASKNRVGGILADLYRDNADWEKLIPKLSEAAISQQPEAVTLISSSLYGPTELDINALAPSLSVSVFKDHDINTKRQPEPEFGEADDATIAAAYESPDGKLYAFLLETVELPRWCRDSNLVELHRELSVFYRSGGYVFEASTNERFGSGLRDWLFGEKLRQPGPEIIAKAAGGQAPSAYYTLGLRSAVANSNSQPSYKMLMGAQAENGVRNSDSISFTSGHAILRVDGEVRGVALDSKRVWTMKRGTLKDFTLWCDAIADNLNGRSGSDTLPGINIVNPRSAPRIEERPLAVLLDEILLRTQATVSVSDAESGKNVDASVIPHIKIKSFDEADKVLECEFIYGEDGSFVSAYMSSDRNWTVAGKKSVDVHFDANSKRFNGSLEEFLQKFPPSIVLATQGIVRGDEWHVVAQRVNVNIPPEMIRKVDWGGCDITIERADPSRDRFPKPGHRSVQEQVAFLLKENYPKATIVFDDGSGEISDYIVIDDESKMIGFYHCKASGGKKPGARVGDIYEVFGQACKSTRYVRYPNLIAHVEEHRLRRGSPFTQGSISKARASKFRVNQWKYKIVVVQPGLSMGRSLKGQKTAPLIASLLDYIEPTGAAFEFWASE